jgi:anti-anti-sigma regulatory factor
MVATMATISETPNLERADIIQAVRQCCEQLESADGELVLDLSELRRIDPQILNAIEELADAAERKGVKIALRGVSVGVYKVLKLLKLASQFSYFE